MEKIATAEMAPVSRINMETIYYEADRKYGGDGDLLKLSRSMGKVGLIQPIVLCAEEDGQYRIIAGRRRFEAAKLLEWDTIEAKLMQFDGAEDGEEVSLMENVNREEMSPIDEAKIFQKQLADGRDINELAQYYNRSISAIYQRIRLTKLIDGLKEFYRAGKINITAAALIAVLDEKLQEKFYLKFKDYEDISISSAEDFLHSVQHNRLVSCVTDKKCEVCTKRTNHSDKNLFPEYDGLEDVCFDDSCYAKKWTAFLAKKIKAQKSKEPGLDTENILVLYDLPKFYQGNTLTLDKTEYQIKRYDWDNRAYDSDENGFYVWEFSLSYYGSQIDLKRGHYKEKKEKENLKQPVSKFAIESVIDDLPEEQKPAEIKMIDEALGKRYQNKWDYREELEFKIVKKIIAGLSEDPRDLTCEYLKFCFDFDDDKQKELYELMTGLQFTAELEGIETVDPVKIIALLFAFDILDNFEGPEFDAPEGEDDSSDYAIYHFAGMNKDQFNALQRKSIQGLINEALIPAEDPAPGEPINPGEDETEDDLEDE